MTSARGARRGGAFTSGRAARNPLTAALAAMAVHTAASLALGWPYPSVATFLAGMIAVPWALARAPPPASSVGGSAGFVLLLPTVVPPTVLAACLAGLATARLPRADDPLGNLAVALPSLTFLALAMTFA